MYSKIIGTGHYVPDNRVYNEFFENIVDTSDEWITDMTGIKSRYISRGEDTSDLGTKAALCALSESGLRAEEIDMIIYATITADKLTPSASCIVQKNIGAVNAFSFDISAACSGFVYGLTIADQFIKSGKVKNVLMIGGEVLSKVTDFTDRSTCVLFGDGSGAAVLTASLEPGIINTYLGSKADEKNALTVGSTTFSNPFVEGESNWGIKMDGKEVFKFSTQIIGNCITEVLKGTDYKVGDIDLIIPHQANYRLINYAASKMKIPIEKFFLNIEEYGNTSSGSIGIALNDAKQKNLVGPGSLVVLVGFGGGLTWGSLLIKL